MKVLNLPPPLRMQQAAHPSGVAGRWLEPTIDDLNVSGTRVCVRLKFWSQLSSYFCFFEVYCFYLSTFVPCVWSVAYLILYVYFSSDVLLSGRHQEASRATGASSTGSFGLYSPTVHDSHVCIYCIWSCHQEPVYIVNFMPVFLCPEWFLGAPLKEFFLFNFFRRLRY